MLELFFLSHSLALHLISRTALTVLSSHRHMTSLGLSYYRISFLFVLFDVFNWSLLRLKTSVLNKARTVLLSHSLAVELISPIALPPCSSCE